MANTLSGIPFIGRVHDIPEEGSWLKFYEWSKIYGPIYQMEIFGTQHVWISSEQVAHDLLGKKNTIYSDRPVIPNLPDNRTSGDYLALLGRTGELSFPNFMRSMLSDIPDTGYPGSSPLRR